MSFCVTTLLTFCVRDRDRLRELARAHIDTLASAEDCAAREEFLRMLSALVAGSCIGCGQKGYDVFSYGFTGNYTSERDVMEFLAEFFIACFNDKAIPSSCRIILMLQTEQSSQTSIYEISLPYIPDHRKVTWSTRDLIVRGRTMNFPIWSDWAEEVEWFRSDPIKHAPVTKQWEGE